VAGYSFHPEDRFCVVNAQSRGAEYQSLNNR
jgi:hypothetical protein